jgi:formylglycine-generating enzyme required for sulfatase activity
MSSRKVILWLGWVVLIGIVGVVLLVFGRGRDQAASSPGATETAVAGRVLAALTTEAQATPTPSAEVEAIAQETFETWARGRREPFRDAVVTVGESDGFFATVRVTAWFRPGRDAPWEEREAEVECRRVAEEWQCDQWFDFQLTAGELTRRAQATATAEAQATATAIAWARATATVEAQATATAIAWARATATAEAPVTATAQARAAPTATAIAAAQATAVANMPAALRPLADRFGMAFVYVPPGEFTMGSSEAEVDAAFELCQQTYGGCEREWFEAELPQHQVNLDGFWIGRTEVTNAQYRPFVEAGGYQQRELWTEAGWEWVEGQGITQPVCWEEELVNQPDQPVVCVSWYEAVAYTRWLAQETGLEVRLPTEAEWEKAARGTDGRIWPWGKEPPDGTRLNYCDQNCESDRKDEAVDDGYPYTAPAGTYPAGASPYGALDMAGNVWEWTSTLWGGCDWPSGFAYPYRPDDGREELEGSDCRVVRGGGWVWNSTWARCAARVRDGADVGNDSGGLRVVLSHLS